MIYDLFALIMSYVILKGHGGTSSAVVVNTLFVVQIYYININLIFVW